MDMAYYSRPLQFSFTNLEYFFYTMCLPTCKYCLYIYRIIVVTDMPSCWTMEKLARTAVGQKKALVVRYCDINVPKQAERRGMEPKLEKERR